MVKKDTHVDMLFMKKLNDAYDTWDEVNGKIGGIERAVIELQKLFLQFNGKLKDIEKRRLLLHGLTTAELTSEKEENKQSAKLHSKLLMDELNSIPDYKIVNRHKYIKAQNNYIESHKDELSDDEKLKGYEEYYDTYKMCTPDNIMGYYNKLTAEFNINLLKKNDNIVLKIMDILLHNNNKQYQSQFICLTNEIKKINTELYNNVLLLIENENKQNKIS